MRDDNNRCLLKLMLLKLFRDDLEIVLMLAEQRRDTVKLPVADGCNLLNSGIDLGLDFRHELVHSGMRGL